MYELKLLRRGIDWRRARRPHALAQIPAASVMRAAAPVARADEEVAAAAARITEDDDAIAVVDDGRLVGIVTSTALARAAAGEPHATLRSIMRPAPAVLAPGDSLDRAADLLTDPAVMLLPIVDTAALFIGTVTRRDLLAAYRSAREI